MKRKVTCLLLTLIMMLSAVALYGCGGDKNGESTATDDSYIEPTAGGKVIVGMTQDLVSLDPHQITDAGTRSVVFNIYEGLVIPTSTGDIVPAVAEDFVISEDGKTYTFTLRDGVKFQNGNDITVDDVLYSLDRYALIQESTGAFSIVDSVTASDEKTIVVSLKESNYEFIYDLTAAIIPKDADMTSAETIIAGGYGSGPFAYSEYVPGQKLVLTKNENYRDPERPYLDEVEFAIFADVESAYIQLQAKNIDILNYLTIDQVDALGDDFQIVEGNMNMYQALFLNNAAEPLNNVDVRKAIYYAVDREAINAFLFGGRGTYVGGPMIPAMSIYFNEDVVHTYDRDVEKAKELLKSAGYENGFDLQIDVPSSYSQHVATAEIIAENLKEVGINVKINKIEWNSWLSDVYVGRNYQATVVSIDGKLSPQSWMARYESTSGKNLVNFNNAEYDETFAKAIALAPGAEKEELYKKLQTILSEDAASAYIADMADLVGTTKKVHGYVFYPNSAWDMSVVFVTEE